MLESLEASSIFTLLAGGAALLTVVVAGREVYTRLGVGPTLEFVGEVILDIEDTEYPDEFLSAGVDGAVRVVRAKALRVTAKMAIKNSGGAQAKRVLVIPVPVDIPPQHPTSAQSSQVPRSLSPGEAPETFSGTIWIGHSAPFDESFSSRIAFWLIPHAGPAIGCIAYLVREPTGRIEVKKLIAHHERMPSWVMRRAVKGGKNWESVSRSFPPHNHAVLKAFWYREQWLRR